MNKKQFVAQATLTDAEEAQELLNAVPVYEDYVVTKRDPDNQYGNTHTHEEEHVLYCIALKEAVEPYIPRSEFNFPPFPKRVDVTCDDTVEPFLVKAVTESGETLIESEGYSGLIELQKLQKSFGTGIEYYYMYDETVYRHVTPDLFGLGVKSEDGKHVYVLKGSLDIYKAISHVNAFHRWAKLYIEWAENPDDFYNSYRFVKSHPAMWLNDEKEDWVDPDREAWLWHELMKDDDGNTVHMFETGTAVKPARQQHYHTLEFDVYSRTYEEGIVQLAYLVNSYWKWDGTERPEMANELSDLSVELQKRMQDYEDTPPDERGPYYSM